MKTNKINIFFTFKTSSNSFNSKNLFCKFENTSMRRFFILGVLVGGGRLHDFYGQKPLQKQKAN